jgi:dTDP-4-dehydrorhamnose 3,5-epimerase
MEQRQSLRIKPKNVVVSPGFAHGFGVLSEIAPGRSKATDFYDKEAERTISWNDPA